MKIAIGSDHAGYPMKQRVKAILEAMGADVIDFGTDSTDSVDYPDFGIRVARAVASGEAERGVAVCMTGGGMTIVANKIRGIRAVLCLNREMAFYARSHNDANVLTLSQKYVDDNKLGEIIKTWLETGFEGGRHCRRLDKIAAVEGH